MKNVLKPKLQLRRREKVGTVEEVQYNLENQLVPNNIAYDISSESLINCECVYWYASADTLRELSIWVYLTRSGVIHMAFFR